MPGSPLDLAISEHLALLLKLQEGVASRRSMAQAFHEEVRRRCKRPIRGADLRIVSMASLVLEAHQLAVQEENGATVDVLTDALEHLKDRLEREVLPELSA